MPMPPDDTGAEGALDCRSLGEGLVDGRRVVLATDADALLTPDDRSDGCHYSESGQRKMAAAYAADGIRVNAIAPGPVDTDMVRNNPQEVIDVITSNTLMKRLANPDELVGTALLLCSGAGSYITGQVVIVDGGGTPR